MAKQRLTITLASSTLDKIDQLIDKKEVRSRSHAIESILQQHLQPQISIAVILAGGKTTTSKNFKPLLEYQDKPLILHQLELLKNHSVKTVFLTTNREDPHLASLCQKSFPEISLTQVVENEPLGTAGALLNLKPKIEQAFFCLHADIFTTIDLTAMAQFHQAHGSVATLSLIHI